MKQARALGAFRRPSLLVFSAVVLWLTACDRQHAPVVGTRWPGQLSVLVSAEEPTRARSAVSAIEARLRTLQGVESVHGARSSSRLFFALRWPLYLSIDELLGLQGALRAERPGTSDELGRRFILPIALANWQRANLLMGASLAYAATPDERAIAVLVRTHPGADEAVRGAVRALAGELGKQVQVSVDAPGAAALLYGASAPLRIVAASATRAREIVDRLGEIRRRDPGFAIREARGIEAYLPGRAQPQLALSQAIRTLLTSEEVSRWPQARRDAVRKLVPFAMTRLPSARDVPDHVSAIFRTGEGDLERTLLLLPRPGLDPAVASHRIRVRRALAKLGITEHVEGAFVDGPELAPEHSPFWFAPWMLGLSGLAALIVWWRSKSPLVRRVAVALAAMVGLTVALAYGMTSLVRDWLRGHAPQLSFGALDVWPPCWVDAHELRLTLGTATLEAERARLLPTGLTTLRLHAEGVVLHIVKQVDGRELREELALGNVIMAASFASLPQPTRIVVRGGDLTLVLGSQVGRPGLSGELRLMPALFGRLPLLGEAGEIEGFSTATSAAQAVRLTPAWAIERP